jgi:hypothetical protein
MKNGHKISVGSSKERNHLGDLGLNGRILKRLLKE